MEIRVAGVNKASGSLPFLSRSFHDFVLFVEDDDTDEELFAVLPAKAYSIRVGLGETRAEHTVPHVQDVIELLGEMAVLRDSFPVNSMDNS